MRAISGLAALGKVKLEPNPSPAPQANPSSDPVGISPMSTPRTSEQSFVEGDPDRPDFQTRDFSNGAIYVKIPGIIDVGDLPDGLTGLDVVA